MRSAEAQLELSRLRAREALVRARTLLVNAARGLAKAHGQRLPRTATKSFAVRAAAELRPELAAVLEPLLSQIAALSEAIQQGRAKPGMLVLLAAFGSGFTWGAALVRI